MTSRTLGTMITYGYARVDVEVDLAIASRLGATALEILPDWRSLPNPTNLRNRVLASPFTVHSVHGAWGSQTMSPNRVDLGDPDPQRRAASVDDVRRCLDWLEAVGGNCLIVHPGGLSDEAEIEARRDALAESLGALADHVHGQPGRVCVENMPPGVFPGSRMHDLYALLQALGRVELALAVDTGHANVESTAAAETLVAGSYLRSTHVHDNLGKADSHAPPGTGTVDWRDWRDALDAVGYQGPIMLECIRRLREQPESLDDALLQTLAMLQGRESESGGRCRS